MIRLAVLLVIVAGLAAVVAAAKLLGWWAVIVLPVAALVIGKLALGPLLKRAFMMPFKAKGAVLRAARVQVHGVKPCAAPVPDEEGAESLEDAAERDFFVVEATITPAAPAGGAFQLWEPGELRLVPPGFRPEGGEDSDACEVVRLEIQQDGQWVVEEGMKYGGPQRLRLTAGVKRGQRQLRFQYYFELFGQLSLPAVVNAAARKVT